MEEEKRIKMMTIIRRSKSSKNKKENKKIKIKEKKRKNNNHNLNQSLNPNRRIEKLPKTQMKKVSWPG